MKEIIKSLFLLIFIFILVLPVEAVPGELSEYGNFTEGSGLNRTGNVSRNYFDSDSGLICVAAGKTSENGEIISADELIEEITFFTDSPESELSPVWTADGEYILYTVKRNDSDYFESYQMRANGSEVERIGIEGANLTGFSDLSLDGRDLVFMKSIDSQLDLYLVSLENGTAIPVASDPQVSESWGAWCRLGKKITYTQESAGIPPQLWIVDKDGSNKTRLGDSENVGAGKDWCPLGLRVIYNAKNSKDTYDLWVIDFYGTNQTQLTNTSYNEWNPSFSPGGKWIVYVSDEGGSPDIWIRDIEGNYRSRLTNNIGSPDSVPMWSPDGSKIVFTGYSPGANSIAGNFTHLTDNNTINGSNNGSNIDTSAAVDATDMTNGSDAGLTGGIDTGLISDPNIDPLNYSGIDPTDSSNTDPVNDSNSDLINSADKDAVNGSDIVVIKLLTVPYVSPVPKITGIKVDPPEGVTQDGNITLSVAVTNGGGKTSEGYISVSFPGREKIEGVEGTGSSVNTYSEGSFIQGGAGEITAQYPLVELAEYEWGAGQEEILNITLLPKNGTEEIVFFVRTGLRDDRTETYRIDPLLSADKDQQGFDVYRYSLKVA